MDQITRDRFWAKVDKAGSTPERRPDLGRCWLWSGLKYWDGYGRFDIGRSSFRAHRVAYELAVPIPKGLVLDHLCRNRLCVNVQHLEPVKQRENVLRGETVPARNAAKTHCPQGHLLDGPNIYICPRGRRNCRACRRTQLVAFRARQRGA